MPRALLEARKKRLLVARLEIDHAIGTEAGLSKSRRKQVLSCKTPEDLPACPSGNASGKQCSSSTVNRAVSATCDFVQRADHQSAARQLPVDCVVPERQYGARTTGRTLQPSHSRAQIVENPVRGSFH